MSAGSSLPTRKTSWDRSTFVGSSTEMLFRCFVSPSPGQGLVSAEVLTSTNGLHADEAHHRTTAGFTMQRRVCDFVHTIPLHRKGSFMDDHEGEIQTCQEICCTNLCEAGQS